MDYQKQIRDFVVTNFLYGEAAALTDDASFLESGIIDSTGMLELVAFVERDFQMKVLDEEMVPENLDSVTRLAKFVEKKKPGPSVAAKL